MKLVGLLFFFWLLGAFFGAGFVDCLWAARDGDGLGNLFINMGLLVAGTVVFFIIAYVKQKPVARKPAETNS